LNDSQNRHTDIFDRRTRRLARDRAFAGREEYDFLHRHAESELLARVELAGDDSPGPELRIGLFTPPPPDALRSIPAMPQPVPSAVSRPMRTGCRLPTPA